MINLYLIFTILTGLFITPASSHQTVASTENCSKYKSAIEEIG